MPLFRVRYTAPVNIHKVSSQGRVSVVIGGLHIYFFGSSEVGVGRELTFGYSLRFVYYR